MSAPITLGERLSLLARIASKCEEEGACLLWRGAVSIGGVPQVSFRNRAHSVRRILHECHTGQPVPTGMIVASRCRNPLCVAQDCAILLTVRDLRQIDARRGIFSNPAANAARSLAARRRTTIPDAVIDLVRTFDGTCAEAAKAAGISRSHAIAIRAGRARKPLVGNVWGGLLR